MDDIEHEMTTQGAVIIEHVAEAWRALLLLPDRERERVADYLAWHYDWDEVEADATALWRASLSA